MRAEYQQIETASLLIDRPAMEFVQRPDSFDVVVASSLFGDILTGLAAIVVGSMGLAASANIAVDRNNLSMFEPVHGSAPDIAGKDVANPIACLLSLAMALRYSFDDAGSAELIEQAVKNVLAGGLRTGDIMQPGKAKVSTSVMGDAILGEMDKLSG